MNNPNNEPAFPHTNPNYDGNWDKRTHIEGMFLRDYFAAKALQGMLATPEGYAANEHALAKSAYAQADAMLEARKK
jgi:hypothetical protein